MVGSKSRRLQDWQLANWFPYQVGHVWIAFRLLPIAGAPGPCVPGPQARVPTTHYPISNTLHTILVLLSRRSAKLHDK